MALAVSVGAAPQHGLYTPCSGAVVALTALQVPGDRPERVFVVILAPITHATAFWAYSPRADAGVSWWRWRRPPRVGSSSSFPIPDHWVHGRIAIVIATLQ